MRGEEKGGDMIGFVAPPTFNPEKTHEPSSIGATLSRHLVL